MPRPSCSNCRAPLELDRRRGDLVRCLYCGYDHRIHQAPSASDEDASVESEKRVGAIIAPYLFGWLLGYVGYLVVRDFWWSCYDARPFMVFGGLSLLAGILSFRAAAALLLALVGLAGVLKPFLRPIAAYDYAYDLSPTSESAMYYLIPGVVSLVVSYIFVESLKLKKAEPVLRALRPRITVAAITVVGTTVSFFLVGPSLYHELVARDERLVGMYELGKRACTAELVASTETPTTLPIYDGGPENNTAAMWCGYIDDPLRRDLDPIYLDDIHDLLGGANERNRWSHKGVSEYDLVRLDTLDRLEYLIFFDGDESGVTAVLIHIESGAQLAKVSVLGSSTREMRDELMKELGAATQGRFIAR